jgi:uncharacterized protein (DUF433 family)
MKDRIAVNPQIHFGKPCVAGTRIPVQSVLELVREGIPFTEIIRDYYPDLQPEDIRACIQYAKEAWAGVDAICDRLSASDRSFSDSADLLREDRDR